MDNLAYDHHEEVQYEILDGIIVNMAPAPVYSHISAADNIHAVFRNFLKGKRCVAIPDGCDVHLSKKDVFKPDVMIVCDKEKIKYNGVYGAPDLVVEVLSPSSVKKDRGYKKDVYEKSGVREYWIVDIKSRSVEVYLLTEGRFVIDNVYILYSEYLLSLMTDEERAEVKHEVKTSLYDDLLVPLDAIFDNILDEPITFVREDE